MILLVKQGIRFLQGINDTVGQGAFLYCWSRTFLLIRHQIHAVLSLSLTGTIHSVLVNLLVIAQWHSVSEIVLTGRGDEANFNKNNCHTWFSKEQKPG
jgi:DNA integrity scanning protein DisA with diadenylate cyclase activity